MSEYDMDIDHLNYMITNLQSVLTKKRKYTTLNKEEQGGQMIFMPSERSEVNTNNYTTP